MGQRHASSMAIAAFLSLLATGCDRPPGNRGGSQDPGDQPTVLIRGNGGEPQTLDPARADDIHAFNVLYDLYEGLVTEAADGELVGGAAERWEISEDGLSYRFFLRPDSRWSNGEPVTARQFVAGIRRGVAPGTASPYGFLLSSVRNAEAIMAGDLPDTSLGIHAESERILSLELERPSPDLLAILTMPIAYPIFGDKAGPVSNDRFNSAATFVGNGAYVLDQWRPLDRIVLKRNAQYRNAARVEIDEVIFLPIENPQAELNRYRAGEIDITHVVPPTQVAELRNTRKTELRIAPKLATYYLAFDLTEKPFSTTALRRALSMAIDRNAIVDLLGRGEIPAYGLVPPGVSGYTGKPYAWQALSSEEREAEARQWYASAGYNPDKPLRVTLSYDAGDVHQTVALAIQSMWQSVLGANVALESKEWKYYLASREDRSSWQIMRFAWFGDYNGASTFTDILRSANPQNLPMYQNPEYDRLLDEAAISTDNDQRLQLTVRAERKMLDDYPIIPLYFFVSKHLVSPRITNFHDNVLDRHPSQYLGKRSQQD